MTRQGLCAAAFWLMYAQELMNTQSRLPLLTHVQEMGLGKTLTTLALVCSSLDSFEVAEAQKSSTESIVTKPLKTLIITPLSSMWHDSSVMMLRTYLDFSDTGLGTPD